MTAMAGISTAFSGFVERLNPRERVLLGVMSLVALGMICFLAVLLTNRSLNALEEQVSSQALLLRQMREAAPQLSERLAKTSAPASKASVEEPPALGTQLQAHATKAGMGETDLEMTPQPEERIGNWVRKSVQVRLRRKPLGELANFWALTVNDKARYPVAITKLSVRRRRNEDDAYDVEMIVSAYHPSEEPAPSKTKGRTTPNRSKSRP